MKPTFLPQNQMKLFQLNLRFSHCSRTGFSILNTRYLILSLLSIISLITSRRLAGIFCLLSLFCLSVSAQSGLTGFNYQAVVRNTDGTVLANKNVKMRFSLLKGSASGAEVYSESQSLTSNQLGLVTHIIGRGTPESGTFSAVDFSSADLYLKVGIDLNGGSSFQPLGAAELVAVPYALYAASGTPGPQGIQGPPGPQGVQGIQGPPGADGADASLTGAAGGDLGGNFPNPSVTALQGSPVSGTAPASGQVLQYDGTNWSPATLPTPTGDDWGTQTTQTDATLLGDGTTASPLSIAPNGATNGQVLQYDGANWLPSTLPTPTGDDWGVQIAQTDVTLTGDGTTASPLSIAPNGATTGQVLQFDGASWAPSSLPTPTGDDWGAQVTQTEATLSGDGTVASPLALAQQGATAGQILQWDGIGWTPAPLPIPTGDDWGTQVNQTDASLTGDGTTASPLSIAPNGATSGQVLQFDGTNWLPGTLPAVTGDDWGTQTAQTNATLSGDGTTASPLALSQQGATTGQVLKWNGTAWLPANDDNSGGGGAGWVLAGNVATATDFIGTTNNENLRFKVNNIEAGVVSATVDNTALGRSALPGNTGDFNTAMGTYSMVGNTTGHGNASFGYRALNSNSTGARNLALGFRSLYSNTTGAYNIGIGAFSDVDAPDLRNAIAIGSQAIVSQNNAMVLGSINGVNRATASVNVGIGTTAPDQSAVLDLTSTKRGVLVPRMTSVQRGAIASPATGLLVYDTDVNSFWFYNGTAWTNLSAGGGGGGTGWALTGNAVTATDFIGTTNDQDFRIKVNNIAAGLITDGRPFNTVFGQGALPSATNTGTSITAIGYSALSSNTSGNSNIAIGDFALRANTTGHNNVAIGSYAMGDNNSGLGNTAIGNFALHFNDIGDYNTAIGYYALSFAGAGNNNTAVGYHALRTNGNSDNNSAFGDNALGSNQSGNNNTAVGATALDANLSGGLNVAVGVNALGANTTGEENTAIGTSAMADNIDGSFNSAFGRHALKSNTTANFNTAVGYRALYSNTTGPANTAIGTTALYNNTTGDFSTAVGYHALMSNTTGRLNTAIGAGSMESNLTGISNVAIGHNSLNANTGGLYNTALGYYSLFENVNGDLNTASGYYALRENTEGIQNTASGAYALRNNTGGDNNAAFGYRSLGSNTTGGSNVAVGAEALFSNIDGASNTAIGGDALFANTTGIGNVAVGKGAMEANVTGNNSVAVGFQALSNSESGANVAIGVYAMQTNVNGTGNTVIGQNADVAAPDLTNATAVGSGAVVSSSNTMRFGNNNVTGWGFGTNPNGYRVLVVGTNNTNGNGAYLTHFGDWTNTSDRNRKENFTEINGQLLLEGIMQLPVTRWNYKGNPEASHIGPMAQDFYRLFNVGNDNTHISTIDPSGIALRAIQELVKENQQLKSALKQLQQRVAALEDE